MNCGKCAHTLSLNWKHLVYFLVYIFIVGSLTFNHTNNQNPPMSMSLTHHKVKRAAPVKQKKKKPKTRHIENVCRHSLDCMTEELWDSCSVHRFHPSSRSTRCLSSPNCSYIPSFLQFRGSSCLLKSREYELECLKKKKKTIAYFFLLQLILYQKCFIFDRQTNVSHTNPKAVFIKEQANTLSKIMLFSTNHF